MPSLTTEELDILEQKQTRRSFSTEELDAMEEQLIVDPITARERAGQVWDTAAESNIPISEAENLFTGITEQKQRAEEGLVKRFGKQLYNNLIANTVHNLGKSDLSAVETRAYELVTQWEKENNVRLAENFFDDQLKDWTYQLTLPPEVRESDYLKNERQYEPPSFVNPFAAEVTEPESVGEKIIDTVTGITGFIVQIALLKKFAPSMPEPIVWETVNLANGGKPGAGAAMQVTLGGIAKYIPGGGVLPAVERGTAASILFGTTTYLGGGDTVDILVNMGIPFAFEGMGITKQVWANYANKGDLIGFLKQKAPALQRRSNIEVEKAISDLLTNVTAIGIKELRPKEQMAKEYAPKKPAEDLSVEVKDYLQRKRYDELLERASTGEKKAIRELNDWVTGANLPTYEELLEKGFNGDVKAFEQIQLGNYFGGEAPRPELKIPSKQQKQKTADITAKRKLTPIEAIKARKEIFVNDMRPPEKIASEDLAKARERGFITSVKEVVPELKIEGQYIPRPTDPLAIKARNLVIDNIARAEQIALTGNSDISVACASELIKYYGNKGINAKNQGDAAVFYDRAAAIANNAAYKLTEQGRAVQAASILGRLTPEGQVRFAAKEIQRYNEKVATKRGSLFGLRKKIPELTAEQAEYILKEMKEITGMADGKAKIIRFNKLQNYVSELVPTPLYNKLITIWKAGLLTGIKTHGLNLYANIHHFEIEIMKDVPAAAVDKIVSYFTGKRTVVPSVKYVEAGAIEGFKKGLEYIKTGYSERDIGVKFDYIKVNMGKGNIARALQFETEGIFRLMGAGDQPFYYAAKARSLYEQAKVAAINQGLKGKAAQKFVDNLVQNPTEQMIKYATKDAETAVFINNTKLGDFARGLQRLPGGEVIVPFSRTPSAVAMQIVNYSPIGAVKTIIENIGKGRFDQRAFSQGIGRSITGTAVLFIGTKLYSAGLITLDRPTNEKERKLWELEGRQPNSIKIGDKWRTVQSFGPAGNLLIIGGHFQRAFEESGSPTEAMSSALAGSAKSFTEQTFVRGVNQFVSALSDPERSAPYVAGNTISSIIPTIVSDVARATDVKERRAETVGQKLLAKIPGARQTLEPQITVFGEEKKPTSNPIELMIDPTRPSKDISSPVVVELRRLWEEGWEVSPSLLGTRKGYEPLSQEENTQLWKRAGQLTKDGLEMLISNPLYSELSDDKKAEAITKIIDAAQTAAKAETVGKKLQGLQGEELTKMIYELRKSGVATQEIIPIKLSKQKPEKARKTAKSKK